MTQVTLRGFLNDVVDGFRVQSPGVQLLLAALVAVDEG